MITMRMLGRVSAVALREEECTAKNAAPAPRMKSRLVIMFGTFVQYGLTLRAPSAPLTGSACPVYLHCSSLVILGAGRPQNHTDAVLGPGKRHTPSGKRRRPERDVKPEFGLLHRRVVSKILEFVRVRLVVI